MDAGLRESPPAGEAEFGSPVGRPSTRPAWKDDGARDLAQELAILPTLDLHELRVRWRKLTRSTAPEHLSRALLLRLVAYKMQAKVYGDLDPETARYLARVAKARARRLNAGETRKPKAPPSVPPVPSPSGLKPGTLIGREYNGVVHRVTVVEGGYQWDGHVCKSLSDIARRITGTRWNGPKFFGLRSGKSASGSHSYARRHL